MKQLYFVLSSMLLISSCGSLDSISSPTKWFGEAKVHHPKAELVNIADPIKTRVLWTKTVGVGDAGQQLGLSPTVSNGQVFVADSEGLVTSLNAQTGSTEWAINLDLPLSGGPGAGLDLVVVGTENGKVIALDRNTGTERWRSRVTSEILSTPAIGQDRVVVHTIDGRLFGLDAATGKQVWRYDRETAVLTLRGSSSPVIDGDKVICGFSGGKLVALSLKTGLVKWDTTIKVPSGRSELERLADIDGDPLVYGAAVYVATFQGSMAAVGVSSGRQVWREKISSYGGVAANWRYVYVGNDEGHIWALDPENGKVEWKQEGLFGRSLSTPAVMDGFVFVGDKEGYVHILDTSGGDIAGRFSLGSTPITSKPVEHNGILYVFNTGGDIAAIEIPDS